MVELTRATRRDSSIMRLVAIITMIYLPGAFVAVSNITNSYFT